MPRPCPACGRPNSDHAARCLYCDRPLSTPAEAEGLAPAEAPADSSSRPDRHLIILSPQKEIREGGIEALVRLTGMGTYESRLALQTQRHRMLQRAPAERARELAASLARAGIAHYVVPESEVEDLTVAPIRRLTLGSGSLDVALATGDEASVPYASLLLLVEGEIRRERHRERRIATMQGAHQPLTPGRLLHLYTRGAERALELDPERFEWNDTGGEASPSTPLKLNKLVDAILVRAPGAELDRGFAWEPVVLSRSASTSEVNAMLSGLSDPGGREPGVMHDNEAQFRFYARWRYSVAARAAARSS